MGKSKVLILEGVDKVGKSSVHQAFRRMTKYGPLAVDRFLGSNFVYDSFWGREHHIKNYSLKERSFGNLFDVYLVYLVCDDKEDHEKRLIDGNEDMYFPSIKHIDIVDKLFYLYYSLSVYKNKTIIDTSGNTAYEVAELIVKFMEDKIPLKPPMNWARRMNKIKLENIMDYIAEWGGTKWN